MPSWAQAIPDNVEEAEQAKDASTEINVKNADIAAVVRIFSKKTKRNYILDERVKGKVSIYLPGKVTAEESLRILDSVLSFKGFASVPISENLWKIVPSKEAGRSTIPTRLESSSETPSAAMITRLVSLKYVSADDMKNLISQLVSNDGVVNAYTGTNSLIIIDSEDNIERLLKIIDTLDVPYSDRDMTIIPVVNADAVDISAKINEIMGTSAGAAAKADQDADTAQRLREIRDPGSVMQNRAAGMPNPPVPGQVMAVPPLGGKTVGTRAREPKIIADERTNSIIVLADEDLTARIRALIAQLDSKMDLSGNRFYVYRCKHASAEELAEVLSGLGGEGGSSNSNRASLGNNGTGNNDNGFASSRSQGRSSASSRTQQRISGQSRVPGRSRSEESQTGGGTKTATLGENISITADPATNSLIINASKQDYLKIKTLLEDIDIKRRQVLVEAMLVEVGVRDTEAMSVDFLSSAGGADGGFLARNDSGNLANLLSDPTSLSNFSVAAASSGSLTLPGDITIPTQAILLSAVKTNQNANVLSAPTILTTDNEQAEIVVGQNIPFITSTSTSGDNLNNTFNQIDRQDVGITLRLTPQISSGDFVTLQIFTEVSNVLQGTVASNLGPTTTIRTSETKVITKDSQMIVIGGLMSDDVSDTETGVPFFKDIPVLGHLFRATNSERRRTNLLIFITPRIVKDQFDAREVSLKHRDGLEDVMISNEIYPDREEVLQNMDLDRVAETKEYEGALPGTILPPVKKQKVYPSNRVELHPRASDTGSFSTKEQGAIELRVSPKFSAQKQDSARTVDKNSLALANTDQYILLKINEGATSSASGLPFAVEGASGLAGIVIPAESAASAKSFFKAGNHYLYQGESSQVSLVPEGIFSSEAEARQTYAQFKGTWYVLSPHELMNIGSGPWRKQD